MCGGLGAVVCAMPFDDLKSGGFEAFCCRRIWAVLGLSSTILRDRFRRGRKRAFNALTGVAERSRTPCCSEVCLRSSSLKIRTMPPFTFWRLSLLISCYHESYGKIGLALPRTLVWPFGERYLRRPVLFNDLSRNTTSVLPLQCGRAGTICILHTPRERFWDILCAPQNWTIPIGYDTFVVGIKQKNVTI